MTKPQEEDWFDKIRAEIGKSGFVRISDVHEVVGIPKGERSARLLKELCPDLEIRNIEIPFVYRRHIYTNKTRTVKGIVFKEGVKNGKC